MQEGQADPAWDRCENLWWWSVACATHRCPLVGISWFRDDPPEQRVFMHTPDLSAPHISIEPAGRPMPRPWAAPLLSVAGGWMLDVQGLCESQEPHPPHPRQDFKEHAQFDESVCRLIVRDLVMMSACDVQGMCILEWGLPSWRRWVWRCADGSPLAHPPSWVPLGDLYLRQEAIRLACQIWHWLHGDLHFDRPLDKSTYMLLREVRPTSSYGRLFAAVLPRWPRPFRTKWTQVFGGPWHREHWIHRAPYVQCNPRRRCNTRQLLRLSHAGAHPITPSPHCSIRFVHLPHTS